LRPVSNNETAEVSMSMGIFNVHIVMINVCDSGTVLRVHFVTDFTIIMLSRSYTVEPT